MTREGMVVNCVRRGNNGATNGGWLSRWSTTLPIEIATHNCTQACSTKTLCCNLLILSKHCSCMVQSTPIQQFTIISLLWTFYGKIDPNPCIKAKAIGKCWGIQLASFIPITALSGHLNRHFPKQSYRQKYVFIHFLTAKFNLFYLFRRPEVEEHIKIRMHEQYDYIMHSLHFYCAWNITWKSLR